MDVSDGEDIVSTLDLLKDKTEMMYIVMEFAPAVSFRKIEFTDETCRYYLYHLIKGLNYSHSVRCCVCGGEDRSGRAEMFLSFLFSNWWTVLAAGLAPSPPPFTPIYPFATARAYTLAPPPSLTCRSVSCTATSRATTCSTTPSRAPSG